MSQISFRSLLGFNFEELATLFQSCFEDYVIPVNHITAAAMANRSCRDGIDHTRSFAAVRDGEPVAIALAAPRYERIRLAGMGVVKAARGVGIGNAAVDEFLRRAREDHFVEAVLEVFEQNLPAVKLYESFGFAPTQRLYGFTTGAGFASDPGPLRTTSLEDYVAALRESSEVNLPEVQCPDHMAAAALPQQCWTLDGEAYACGAKHRPGQPIWITAFVTRPKSRRQGRAHSLFKAIAATHPESKVSLPQIIPEAVSPFFEAIGFERMELNQSKCDLHCRGKACLARERHKGWSAGDPAPLLISEPASAGQQRTGYRPRTRRGKACLARKRHKVWSAAIRRRFRSASLRAQTSNDRISPENP